MREREQAYCADDLVPLSEVAAELHTTVPSLKEQAKRGDFPELLRVNRANYLVKAKDLAAWKAGRWTRAEEATGWLKANAAKSWLKEAQ